MSAGFNNGGKRHHRIGAPRTSCSSSSSVRNPNGNIPQIGVYLEQSFQWARPRSCAWTSPIARWATKQTPARRRRRNPRRQRFMRFPLPAGWDGVDNTWKIVATNLCSMAATFELWFQRRQNQPRLHLSVPAGTRRDRLRRNGHPDHRARIDPEQRTGFSAIPLVLPLDRRCRTVSVLSSTITHDHAPRSNPVSPTAEPLVEAGMTADKMPAAFVPTGRRERAGSSGRRGEQRAAVSGRL